MRRRPRQPTARLRLIAGLVSLAVVAVAYFGCRGAGGEGEGEGDAGMDAGSAEHDAAGAGAADARSDGEGFPPMPGWTPIEGLPDGCYGWVADDPSELRALEWEPCFDGREGCRQLRVDWGDWREEGTLGISTRGNVWRDGDEALLEWGREIEDGIGQAIVTRLGGERLFAVRANNDADGCGNMAFRWTPTRVAFGWIEFGDAPPARYTLLRGAMDSFPESAERVVHESTELGGRIQRTVISDELMALELVPLGRIGIWPHGGPVQTPDMGESDGDQPMVLGDRVFYHQEQPSIAVWTIGPDLEPEPYLDSPDFGVGDFHTDGTHAVWLQGWGRSSVSRYDRLELWTSPYAENPADLDPRPLMTDLGPAGLTVEGTLVASGWATLTDFDTGGMFLFRLEDGARWRIPPPLEHVFAPRPAYLLPDEMGVVVKDEHARFRRTLFRLDLTALGPPDAVP